MRRPQRHPLRIPVLLGLALVAATWLLSTRAAAFAFGTSPPWIQHPAVLQGTTFTQVVTLSVNPPEDVAYATYTVMGCDPEFESWLEFQLPDGTPWNGDPIPWPSGENAFPITALVHVPAAAPLQRYTCSWMARACPALPDGGVGICLGGNVSIDITTTDQTVVDYTMGSVDLVSRYLDIGQPLELKLSVANDSNVDVDAIPVHVKVFDAAYGYGYTGSDFLAVQDAQDIWPPVPAYQSMPRAVTWLSLPSITLPEGSYFVRVETENQDGLDYSTDLYFEVKTCSPCNLLDHQTGACGGSESLLEPDGTPCDDANGCTQTDTCLAGACIGSDPVICTPNDDCYVCVPATGACVVDDGAPCDDGDLCTRVDVCSGGTCLGADFIPCAPLGPCYEASCDAATGLCVDFQKADGESCEDGFLCSIDHCEAGTCLGDDYTCSAPPQCQMLAPAPAFALTASMSEGRHYHTATLLKDGRVLVVGGYNAPTFGPLRGAELYDPVTDEWSPAADLSFARYDHTATLLQNGAVLVAGGRGPGTLSSVEIYVPEFDAWTVVAAMGEKRYHHTASLLPDGRVLVAAGRKGGLVTDVIGTAELYDVESNTWTAAGALAFERESHSATLLDNGTVLVAGGRNGSGARVSDAEYYAPAPDLWFPAGSLLAGRYDHTATLLPTGRVLVAGGRGAGLLTSAELYDPTLNSWTQGGPTSQTYERHFAVLMNSGLVLVGGYDSLSTTETYDYLSDTWSRTARMKETRRDVRGLQLQTGEVLVVGGYPSLASAELYADSACTGEGDCWTVPETDGTPCSDGDQCTQTDACESGSCAGGNPVVCVAQDGCHTPGVCDPSSGNCSNPEAPTDTPCDDGDPCTISDVCSSGSCAGVPKDCSAESDSCNAGICNITTGVCEAVPANEGNACGDGPTECSAQDTCDAAGLCVVNHSPAATPCGDAGTECTVQDTCDGSGACIDNGFVAANSACGDSADTECDNPDTCDGAGTCLANPEPNTATCGDAGTECTVQDMCDGSGACTDNGFVAADSACGDATDTECNNPDTCDGAGTCLANLEPNTATCGDAGTECTVQDLCDGSGACTDNGFVAADSACGDTTDTECDNPDTCDGAGTCLANLEPDDVECDDGDDCMGPDSCQAGVCVGAADTCASEGGGGTGAGGSAGGGGGGGGVGAGGGTGEGGAAAGGAATAGSGQGAGGAGATPAAVDGGCGCRVPSGRSGADRLGVVLAALALGMVRRRRRVACSRGQSGEPR